MGMGRAASYRARGAYSGWRRLNRALGPSTGWALGLRPLSGLELLEKPGLGLWWLVFEALVAAFATLPKTLPKIPALALSLSLDFLNKMGVLAWLTSGTSSYSGRHKFHDFNKSVF